MSDPMIQPKPVYVITLADACMSEKDRADVEKKLGTVAWIFYNPEKGIPIVQVFNG